MMMTTTTRTTTGAAAAADLGQAVDLVFPVGGAAIPADHGYALYAAVSRAAQPVHGDPAVGIFPIRGLPTGDRSLRLTAWSTLRLRTPAAKLPQLLPLAGRALDLAVGVVRVGVPRVVALRPAPVLASPLVLIKLADPGNKDVGGIVTPEAFLAAARRQLTALNIKAEPALQTYAAGPRTGQPHRRVLRVKGQTHVGYAVVVYGLTAEESILLQERGMGGRRLMGCGLFLPYGED